MKVALPKTYHQLAELRGNLVQSGVLDRTFELDALLEPAVDALGDIALHPRHGESPPPMEICTRPALLERVVICPAKI